MSELGTTDAGPAVVLVLGWNGRPSQWAPIAAGLQAAGYAVYAPTFPINPLRQGITLDADLLAAYLRDTLRDGRPLAEQPLVFIGYSRGGLVARALVRRQGLGTVVGMVHVGVPNLGCPWPYPWPLAPLGRRTELHEMLPGSPLLAWLNSDVSDLYRIPQLAVCGRASEHAGYNDLVVWEDSATLGGRIPTAVIDLLPSTAAWHGNLINRYWYRLPSPQYAPSDRCWPITLRYIRGFLARLP